MVEIMQQFLKNDSETTEPEVLEVCETESTIESTVPSVVATSSQAMSMKDICRTLIHRISFVLFHTENCSIPTRKLENRLMTVVLQTNLNYFTE